MTGPLDKDGFCIDCGEVAEWCVCPPEPGDAEFPAGQNGIEADGGSPLAALKAEVAKAAKDDRPAVAVRVLTEMASNGLDPADRASVRKWIISQRLITAAEFDRITYRRTPAPSGAIDTDPAPDEPLTDLGYARRLIRVYGDRLRYVPAWRRWLIWDGCRWQPDATGQPARWMKAIVRLVTAAALDSGDDDMIRNSLRGESAHAVSGALNLASTEPGIAVAHDQLDADPYLLNCANGTLDLRTGELRPHDPADLLTKVTRAAYRPGARSKAWSAFLATVQPDSAVRDYLGRLFGHSLEGRVAEHVLPICYGPGANGKSTFLNAVMFALGDYAAPADPELLTARDWTAHPTGTADLFGLRLAVLHETDHGRRLAEGTVKRLTGGDPVKARRMREDFWWFTPTHTFALQTNHKPLITGTDEGIWRRIRLIPWNVIIPAEDRDLNLGDRLALEADPILAWLAGGYRAWRTQGLADPEQVTAATGAYHDESDALSRFIDQRCITGPHFTARSAELFAAWSKWCAEEGVEHGTQTAFSLALVDRGFDKQPTRTGKVWSGIGLQGDDAP
jgi:putative DNA primase/helicase